MSETVKPDEMIENVDSLRSSIESALYDIVDSLHEGEIDEATSAYSDAVEYMRDIGDWLDGLEKIYKGTQEEGAAKEDT